MTPRNLGRKVGRVPQYPAAERKRMRQTVDTWRAERGDWCPGYGRPPHHATDLTADHVIAWATVPRVGASPLRVLCRTCNTRQG